jgi:hypothetical protein
MDSFAPLLAMAIEKLCFFSRGGLAQIGRIPIIAKLRMSLSGAATRADWACGSDFADHSEPCSVIGYRRRLDVLDRRLKIGMSRRLDSLGIPSRPGCGVLPVRRSAPWRIFYIGAPADRDSEYQPLTLGAVPVR